MIPRTLPGAAEATPRSKLAPLGDALPKANPPATIPGAAPAVAPTTTAEELTRPRQRRATPPEMIVEALAVSPVDPLEGRPVTLLEVLARASGSQQRLSVTHAYWRLVQTVAEHHYQRESADALARFQPRPKDAGVLKTARASAAAALRAARLAVVAAQHELAEAARLPSTDPLPLPADRPHIGHYRTRFDELFSMRPAPGRTRLIDRTLPIRRRAIDVRAKAVHAAEDALEAVVDAYRAGRADFGAVVSGRSQLALQQQALVASIRQYNDEIADYALAVAPAQIGEQALVAMLITTPVPEHGAAGAGAPGLAPTSLTRQPSGVEPAGLNEPIRPVLQTPLRPTPRSQPTLAPPRGLSSNATTGQPTLAPPRKLSAPPAGQTPTLAPPRDQKATTGRGEAKLPPREEKATTGLGEPKVAPREEKASTGRGEAKLPPRKPLSASGVRQPDAAAPVWWNNPPAAPQPSPSQGPTTRTVRRPQLDKQGAAAAGASALYPALAKATPGARANELSIALDWDHSVPKKDADPITLKDCLGSCAAARRRAVIDAYWVAGQRAAAHQVLSQQAEMLKELMPLALEFRRRPLGAESMLQLHAARVAADAALLEAQVALAESQFELTRQVGRSLAGPWLLPSTSPHSGAYDLKLKAQPRQLVQSWPLRRAAAMVPGLHQSLTEHGTAVVQADVARAAATADYQAGRRPLEDVLASVDEQTRQTLSFLQTLSDYNQAIADYALAVLPPSVPAADLVQTLVLAD